MVKETFHYLFYPANKTTSQMKLTMAVYCFLLFPYNWCFPLFFCSCHGLCAWYGDEWYHLESDNCIPEATWEERKETRLEERGWVPGALLSSFDTPSRPNPVSLYSKGR